MSTGFTSQWLEQHQQPKPKRGMLNSRATKEKAKALMAKLKAESDERERKRVEANRAALSGKKAQIVIGIDPGVKTGVGIYRDGELSSVITTTIIEAIERVKRCHEAGNVMVYVEDARMATYKRSGAKSAAMAQGSGSIKRDCKIWETELTRLGIPHRMVRPNKQSNAIAENKPLWTKLTGWTKRTSEHARDAVMIARRFLK